MVLPWRLNIDSQTEIRTEGLFAALNDCLYRNMNDFRYLMLIDFDEFIVPHTNDTLPQMLAHVDAQKIIVTGNIGRYLLYTYIIYLVQTITIICSSIYSVNYEYVVHVTPCHICVARMSRNVAGYELPSYFPSYFPISKVFSNVLSIILNS